MTNWTTLSLTKVTVLCLLIYFLVFNSDVLGFWSFLRFKHSRSYFAVSCTVTHVIECLIRISWQISRLWCNHIFQSALETSNKMVHKKRHHFLTQFSLPFHMVLFVLLRVLAQKTTLWQVEILWQPIRSFFLMVFEANTRNKTEHTRW